MKTETLAVTVSKIDNDGEYTEGKQHIFKESKSKRLTANMEYETGPQSLCGIYKSLLDVGEWPYSWNDFLNDSGEFIEDKYICKTCLKINNKLNSISN